MDTPERLGLTKKQVLIAVECRVRMIKDVGAKGGLEEYRVGVEVPRIENTPLEVEEDWLTLRVGRAVAESVRVGKTVVVEVWEPEED